MQKILNNLLENQTISRPEACKILKEIANQKYNNCLVSSFLTVFRMRHITVEELGGFRDAMKDLCISIDLSTYNPIDLCGTGGDGKNTFNISTAAAFVVAGSGIKVAKHGNNGVSSRCGSSNVLEQLKIPFTNNQQDLTNFIEEAGICYLHAPLFHPAMKNVAPIRRDLGIRTFFNLLGPLVSPANPKQQMIGVANLKVARLYAYLFQKENRKYSIVHSLDGYDEISLTGPFKKIDSQGENIVYPEDLGFTTVDHQQLSGGETIQQSAEILLKILSNQGNSAQTQVTIANAAFAIHCAKPDLSLEECIAQAKESLISGKALKALTKLQKFYPTIKKGN